jgi:hypothetical protein
MRLLTVVGEVFPMLSPGNDTKIGLTSSWAAIHFETSIRTLSN